jgi:hypothetical protein
VADAISVLPRVNLGDDTPYTELPLRNWTSPNPIQPQNMVVLSSVARRTTPLCGDLNADSAINAVDVARLRSALANPSGSALTPGEAARCSVVGNATDCNVLDSTTVRRRLAGRTPHRLQICTAAL